MTQPPNPTEEPPSSTDRILDHVDNALDLEKEDKKTVERFKHPFVRGSFAALIVLIFLIFITYFLSFILQIPLPESKILETIITSIIEIMKLLVPPSN